MVKVMHDLLAGRNSRAIDGTTHRFAMVHKATIYASKAGVNDARKLAPVKIVPPRDHPRIEVEEISLGLSTDRGICYRLVP